MATKQSSCLFVRDENSSTMIGLRLGTTMAEKPVQKADEAGRDPLVMRFSLASPPPKGAAEKGGRLSPEIIRDISQRKLSARKCSLLRALLIQNALPHLETEEERAYSPNAMEGAIDQARIVPEVEDFVVEEPNAEAMSMDEAEADAGAESLPGSPDAALGLDVEESELASYAAALGALSGFCDADVMAADAADAASEVAEVPATASEPVTIIEPLSLPAKRKRIHTEPDSAQRVAKTVRPASPCGLTERVAAGPAACSRSVFSVIQC